MDPVEYQSVIKFLVKAKKTKEEIKSMLTDVYQSPCPSNSTIYFWIAEFKGGRESMHDNARSGRPVEIDEDSL